MPPLAIAACGRSSVILHPSPCHLASSALQLTPPTLPTNDLPHYNLKSSTAVTLPSLQATTPHVTSASMEALPPTYEKATLADYLDLEPHTSHPATSAQQPWYAANGTRLSRLTSGAIPPLTLASRTTGYTSPSPSSSVRCKPQGCLLELRLIRCICRLRMSRSTMDRIRTGCEIV